MQQYIAEQIKIVTFNTIHLKIYSSFEKPNFRECIAQSDKVALGLSSGFNPLLFSDTVYLLL